MEGNPAAQNPGHFFDTMAGWYTVNQSVGIRRQLDQGDDVATLARLLASIQKHPAVMSRERYIAHHGKNLPPNHIDHEEFDRFAGAGGPHVDPKIVEADLVELAAVAGPVKKYVNKHLAHFDDKHPGVTATYGDLDASLDRLEALLEKYLQLFRCECHLSIVPTFQYDWQSVFRVPWLPPVKKTVKLLR